MAGELEAKIGAGTSLHFEDPDNAGTYILLRNATTIGATGEQGEFVETTTLYDKTRTYTSGMKTPPDKSITMNDIPGDTDQEKFLTLANAGETLNMKVVFANGRVGIFAMVTAGYQVDEPQNNSAQTVTVFGKQSGATDWSVE